MTLFQEPTEMELLHPDPKDGPFRLRVWIQSVKDRPVIVGVEMWGVSPVSRRWDADPIPHIHAAIPAESIRIGLPDLLKMALGALEGIAVGSLWWEDEGQRERVNEFLAVISVKSSGKPRLTDERLRAVAGLYRMLEQSGSSNIPKDLADLSGQNRNTVRSWIKGARSRGLLPPAAKKGSR